MVGALPQRPQQHGKANGQTPTCPQWVVVVDLGLKGAVWGQEPSRSVSKGRHPLCPWPLLQALLSPWKKSRSSRVLDRD